MNENRKFNEDFEIEQAGPEDVGCDLFEYELTPEYIRPEDSIHK